MTDFRDQGIDAAVKGASTAATAADFSAVVALSPNSPVIQATLTKGTQGNTGVSTQDLKDAGRSLKSITLDSFNVAAITETLNTVSISTDTATPTTGTQYTVTASKRFRVQQITATLHTIAGNTTAVNVIVRLRAIVSGTLLVTSPIQMAFALQSTASANGAGQPVDIAIPDGMEFTANMGVGITTTCAGFVATTAAPKVNIVLTGYEY